MYNNLSGFSRVMCALMVLFGGGHALAAGDGNFSSETGVGGVVTRSISGVPANGYIQSYWDALGGQENPSVAGGGDVKITAGTDALLEGDGALGGDIWYRATLNNKLKIASNASLAIGVVNSSPVLMRLRVDGLGISVENEGVVIANTGGRVNVMDNAQMDNKGTGKVNINPGGQINVRGTYHNNGETHVYGELNFYGTNTVTPRNFKNNNKLVFYAASTWREQNLPTQGLAVIENAADITVNLPFKQWSAGVETTSPALKRLVTTTQMMAANSVFNIMSATDATIPILNFNAFNNNSAAQINIGGGAGTITVNDIDTGGSQLTIKGPARFVSNANISNASVIKINGAIYLNTSIAPEVLGAVGTVDVAGAIFHLDVCPTASTPIKLLGAVPGVNIVGVSASMAKCPGYTAVTEEDSSGDLVVRANNWVANPVMPIPVNTPFGLALAGAALAFLGRKWIKKE